MSKKDKQLMLLGGSVVLAVLFGWMVLQKGIGDCKEQGLVWDQGMQMCVDPKTLEDE